MFLGSKSKYFGYSLCVLWSFNVDIISSKEADSLPSESEFASTWREYIEGYRLNVAKHAAYIRNTLKYLNDHFAQLLLLG